MRNIITQTKSCTANGHTLEVGMRAVYMPTREHGQIVEIWKEQFAGFIDWVIRIKFDTGRNGEYFKGDVRPETIAN